MAILCTATLVAQPIVLWGQQKRYTDKVVFSKSTPYQHITVTKWKNEHWLFLNGSKQLCTFDEWLYHEPLIHPAMALSKGKVEVLLLGAGDGCAIRELLK